MLKVEEKVKETEEKIEPAGYYVTASLRRKVAWQFTGKQAGYNTTIIVFEKYRG